MSSSTNDFFDNFGRLIPVNGETVFNQVSHRYYQIFSKPRELSDQIKLYRQEGWLESIQHEDLMIFRLNKLLSDIELSPLKGLLRGARFPFYLPSNLGLAQDIGVVASQILFPKLKHSFEKKYEDFHFKASLQGQISLEFETKPVNDSGHDLLQRFLGENKKLIGWIFPEALTEYSLDSQFKAYQRIINSDTSFYVSLGGIHDVSSALLASPDMLTNSKSYPPVLCLGGVAHSDPRYFFNFKSHGSHLEFWGMPRALTKDYPEQVSEQWSGVISIFTPIDF